MKREPFEVIAISPEPSAAGAPGRECKIFALNNFREPPQCFVYTRFVILIHEQPVVY